VSSQYKSRSPVRTFHRQPFNFSADGRPLSIAAETRAETVFQPIVEARTKAERLKSTLGVFERSKFFFNLPTVLGEAVEEVSPRL
jgi:hypothetical protein